MKTYGKFEVNAGETCSNSPHVEGFTTPCCYSDEDEDATECSDCGAPISCEYEMVPVAVCTIREEEDEDEDE